MADDGQTARARSYVTVYQALPDFPLQAIFVGGYIDEFASQIDGFLNFIYALLLMSIFIAAMGIATYVIFALLERRFTHWATRREQVNFGGG